MSERLVQNGRSAQAPPTGVAPIRVATVITRLEGGAGALAVHGAAAMDSDAFRMTVVTGSGGELADKARAAGIEVIIEPSLRRPIAPRSDLAATVRLKIGRAHV